MMSARLIPERWRFALTRRWFGYLALVVVFAIICSFLGMWQFARRAEARAAIELVEANYDRDPVALTEVLDELDDFEASQKWIPVQVTGRYLTDEELLVRGRPLGGQPGFEVLTPFLLEDGTVFIINRGWVPTGNEQDAPDTVPAAPDGSATVIARLKAGEPSIAGRTSPAGTNQVATINLEEVATRLDRPVYTGAYGAIDSQRPAPAETPVVPGRPELDEGPHLSYALQWYVFALIAFIGLGWALREEYRVVNAADPQERERAQDRKRRREAKAATDAEVEDALLDGGQAPAPARDQASVTSSA